MGKRFAWRWSCKGSGKRGGLTVFGSAKSTRSPLWNCNRKFVPFSEKTKPSLLHFQPELAKELHAKDRVHTYGSFYIADLRT